MQQILKSRLSIAEAAHLMGLSERQVKRLKKGVEQHGIGFLAHKARGKRSNNAIAQPVKQQIMKIVTSDLKGASCEHMSDLLASKQIKVSGRTLRRFLAEAGIPNPHSVRAPKRRRSRRRMPQMGMLVQGDSSPFTWFEQRGAECSLLAFIDDATSRVLSAVFRPTEDLVGYLTCLRSMVDIYGVPAALYTDRHTIFVSPANSKLSIEQELAGTPVSLTQFGRTLNQLGIRHIEARSPQAKGRVERLWRTLQHRLVIEMRLASISTLDQGNRFLPGFIERFNSRFSVAPQEPEPAFRPVPSSDDLDCIVALNEFRSILPGSVLSFNSTIYCLVDSNGNQIGLAQRTKVTIVTALDGSLFALHAGKRYELRVSNTPRQRQSKAEKPVAGADRPTEPKTKRGPGFVFIRKPKELTLTPTHTGRPWMNKQ